VGYWRGNANIGQSLRLRFVLVAHYGVIYYNMVGMMDKMIKVLSIYIKNVRIIWKR